MGSIVPTSNIGTGGAAPAPPTPIAYLTQWKIVGNSEVHTDEYLTQWKVEGNSAVSNPSANLPQGYKKCKYLEFHGTEYIDSGILLKNDIGFSLDLSTTTISKTMIGARNNTLKGVLFGYSFPSTQGEDYRMYFTYGANSNNYAVQTNVCDGLLHHIVLDSQQAKIDNESVVINRGNEFPQMPIFIGTWNNYNGTPDDRMFEGKMYSVRLYDSNGNLFNGIPCLDDNNIPCLYDTVSNTAFYNDGTGTFGYELEQPLIYSCGDLGQDGKYHVKISNGVTIYDIPLTEPLRKVNDVADTIEFVNGVVTLTRNLGVYNISDLDITVGTDIASNMKAGLFVIDVPNRKYYSESSVLTAIYTQVAPVNSIYVAEVNLNDKECCYYYREPSYYPQRLFVYDTDYIGADAATIKQGLQGQILIYELATPTTEVIQASPFPISPTDTYTSANDTPYSAFEYKKNVEIWSCGEYSEVDNKWHIRILPEGYGVVDIALDEPLRKVNDVVDTIEFANGVATLIRKCAYVDLGTFAWSYFSNNRVTVRDELPIRPGPNDVCQILNNGGYTSVNGKGISSSSTQDKVIAYFTLAQAATGNGFVIRDESFSDAQDAKQKLAGIYAVYELATPTTETIQVPQIEEADSYTCVISQGGKAVEWSSFETE